MEIKIGNSSEYLLISNIVPEGQELGYEYESVDFLRGSLELKVKGVTSDIRALFRIDEIEQFQIDLQLLYDTLKHAFVFDSIESNIKINFTPTATGQIEISGYIRNKDCSVTVEFTIETDQSYIPATINQIKDVMTLKG